MVLTYNGISDYTDMITLTGVPNIVSISSSDITGSKAELRINITDLTLILSNKEYTITVNDVTVTSTTGEPGNRKFFISNNNDPATLVAVAYSLAKALRNAGLANYEIFLEANNGVLSNRVIVRAREVGAPYDIKFNTNMGASISYDNFSGTSSDEFLGGKLNIDIYSNNEYVTTLEKSYYKENIDFNISDVLKSISRYNYLTPYTLNIYSELNNSIRSLGAISCKSALGYMCNQGLKYLNNIPAIAQNFGRGTQEGLLNGTVLYTYLPSIPLMIYSNNTTETITINYLNSAKEKITETSANINVYNNIGYLELALSSLFFNQSYYIDLVVSNIGTIRYNVIKPVDANTRCLRVYFHNSYGGVSFFDFTGGITENHKVDNETFTKNLYDYYRQETLELIKIYDKETSIVVTMKSHLMERNAVWQFNDLLGSSDVWTNINGVEYKIIVNDCKVDETETGVWEATVTYTYSLI